MSRFSMEKVLGAGIALAALSWVSFLAPHSEVSTWSKLNNSVQMLLFVLCLFIVSKEPTKRSRYVFLNFAVFFGFSILFHLYNFIPDKLLRFYIFQYVGTGAYYLCLAVAVAYVAIDVLFRELKTVAKYLLVFVIVGGCFITYFHPVLINPLHIHTTPDSKDYFTLKAGYDELLAKTKTVPSNEELASFVALRDWNTEATAAYLTGGALQVRVNQIYPYLANEANYSVLVVRPLYEGIMKMGTVCVFFIFLFFGHQYLKDPPQGAYVDKIMGLFLLFCTMEILHAWSYAQSVEWSSFYEIMNIGQGITLVVLALIGLFFALRLKFITSPSGEYYEQEIASRPAGITRWRDVLDDLIMAGFFKKGGLAGRFFVERNQT